ncbi:MAG: C39 family peptidase [Candidatus Shapirobacteria bacterium]|nr:C39 family peptidase [Candidatus Shapirobacteria bacterium]
MAKKLILFFLLILGIFLVYLKISTPKISSKIENKVDQIVTQVEDIKETIAPKPTKILSTGLPDKHLIQTTFIQQSPEKNWDQPWQDACEEAALLTVDYFYKNQTPDSQTVKNDILKMIDFENQQSFTKDMDIDQMNFVSQRYLGYSTIILNNPTIEDIKEYLLQDIPVVVPANGKTLYQENKHFKSGGPYYHNLTILGFDDTKNQFIVHDVGTQFGAYFKYSYSLLMDSIHDFPKSGHKEDISTGSKKVLILLE